MGPPAFVVVAARRPGANWEAAALQGTKARTAWKGRAAASKVEAGGGELPGCHGGVPRQPDTRNGVCVSFPGTGKGRLRNGPSGKEGGLAPVSPCRGHLWNHFGEINECLWMVVYDRSRSRWCLSAVKYSLEADWSMIRRKPLMVRRWLR